MTPQFIFLKKIANLIQTHLPKGAETQISSRNLHIIDNTFRSSALFQHPFDKKEGDFTMKRRWFVLTAILAMAAVTVFLTSQVTRAQRPDRGERGNRAEGERRGGAGGMRTFNPTSIIDNSWTDLTFSLKVDDDTLIKARPVYQKHRDSLEKAAKEVSSSGDFRAVREAMGKVRDGFQKDLKSILTEEQVAELDTLTQKRTQEQMMRRGGGRGGGGGRGR